MQCPECGLNDVATDTAGTIQPHPRPDTLQLCTPKPPEPEPAPSKAPAKKAHTKPKRA